MIELNTEKTFTAGFRHRPFSFALFVLLLAAFMPSPAEAHGTAYELLTDGLVGVRAMYDSGLPMANARTLVFAPGETAPAFETVTDDQGIVCFHPDREGVWVLQIRADGGHGLRANIEIGDEMIQTADSLSGKASLGWQRKLLMAACVIWGFIGTAAFFAGRRRQPRSK